MNLKQREVKHTRKIHFCHGCSTKFLPGSNLMYYVGVFEGDFGYSYWCKACDAFYNKFIDDFPDGVSPGEFRNEDVYKEFKQQFENKS